MNQGDVSVRIHDIHVTEEAPLGCCHQWLTAVEASTLTYFHSHHSSQLDNQRGQPATSALGTQLHKEVTRSNK